MVPVPVPVLMLFLQGHTAVFVGASMIVFGGIVNGERVSEVRPNARGVETWTWW